MLLPPPTRFLPPSIDRPALHGVAVGMSASVVAVMAVYESPAKMQPHTIQRLLRASSPGNAVNLGMGASPLVSSPAASQSPPAASTLTAAPASTSSSSAVSLSSSTSPAVNSASSSPATTTGSPSSRSRRVSLRSRFSPGHIRISIASRHAAQHDPAANIQEEEDDGREERKKDDEGDGSTESTEYNAARRMHHSSHASASTASPSASSSSTLPSTRSRLQLSQLRPSIHTASRDAPRKTSLLSASPANTPSSTSPRSSFLPTTRPHAHSLSFTTSRLSQHPEDAHFMAAGGSSSSSSLHSRRNSLSRYAPIGNEEQRGRDVDDGGTISARSPHLFSPTAAASPTGTVPSAAVLSMTAAARPTSAGSWRHRRPQSLTAPFSSNAITATTVTGSALSSVGSSSQLSSAQSVSPSVHTVTLPSATSSASRTATPSSSTSSPPSSSYLPPSLSGSASFTSFAHSSASRIVSPLMTSLSPSLISALTYVNDTSHYPHSHTVHVHSTLPAAETIQEETPSPNTVQLTRSSGKEEKRRPAIHKQKVKRVEAKETKRMEEESKEVMQAESEEPRDDNAPGYLPLPQRTVSMPTPITQPPAPRSPTMPQFVSPLPSPLRWTVTSSPPPHAPPSSLAPPPLASHFGPLEDLSSHPSIRMAMRGRSAGSIVLVAAGGERSDEADRADEAIHGRRGSMPVSHYRDWASLTAIQHLSAVTVKLSNQG